MSLTTERRGTTACSPHRHHHHHRPHHHHRHHHRPRHRPQQRVGVGPTASGSDRRLRRCTAFVRVDDAPRYGSWQALAIARDDVVDRVEHPRQTGNLPRPDRPPSGSASCQSQRNRPSASDCRPVRGNRPCRRLCLVGSDPGSVANSMLLRRDDLEVLVVSETPDPPGATRAKPSIPVEDQRGELVPLISELSEVHEESLPAQRAPSYTTFKSGRAS